MQNILFPSVDLKYEMVLFAKKVKIFNLIISFKRKLNQNKLKMKIEFIIFNETRITLIKINKFCFSLLLKQS